MCIVESVNHFASFNSAVLAACGLGRGGGATVVGGRGWEGVVSCCQLQCLW